MKTILLTLIFIAGCTDYNAKIRKDGGTLVLTCKRVVAMDEGGVCHNGYGCSDGKDHIGECWSEVK